MERMSGADSGRQSSEMWTAPTESLVTANGRGHAPTMASIIYADLLAAASFVVLRSTETQCCPYTHIGIR